MLSGIPLGGELFITAKLKSNLDQTLHASRYINFFIRTCIKQTNKGNETNIAQDAPVEKFCELLSRSIINKPKKNDCIKSTNHDAEINENRSTLTNVLFNFVMQSLFLSNSDIILKYRKIKHFK
jgi:hypothetical protein